MYSTIITKHTIIHESIVTGSSRRRCIQMEEGTYNVTPSILPHTCRTTGTSKIISTGMDRTINAFKEVACKAMIIPISVKMMEERIRQITAFHNELQPLFTAIIIPEQSETVPKASILMSCIPLLLQE